MPRGTVKLLGSILAAVLVPGTAAAMHPHLFFDAGFPKPTTGRLGHVAHVAPTFDQQAAWVRDSDHAVVLSRWDWDMNHTSIFAKWPGRDPSPPAVMELRAVAGRTTVMVVVWTDCATTSVACTDRDVFAARVLPSGVGAAFALAPDPRDDFAVVAGGQPNLVAVSGFPGAVAWKRREPSGAFSLQVVRFDLDANQLDATPVQLVADTGSPAVDDFTLSRTASFVLAYADVNAQELRVAALTPQLAPSAPVLSKPLCAGCVVRDLNVSGSMVAWVEGSAAFYGLFGAGSWLTAPEQVSDPQRVALHVTALADDVVWSDAQPDAGDVVVRELLLPNTAPQTFSLDGLVPESRLSLGGRYNGAAPSLLVYEARDPAVPGRRRVLGQFLAPLPPVYESVARTQFSIADEGARIGTPSVTYFFDNSPFAEAFVSWSTETHPAGIHVVDLFHLAPYTVFHNYIFEVLLTDPVAGRHYNPVGTALWRGGVHAAGLFAFRTDGDTIGTFSWTDDAGVRAPSPRSIAGVGAQVGDPAVSAAGPYHLVAWVTSTEGPLFACRVRRFTDDGMPADAAPISVPGCFQSDTHRPAVASDGSGWLVVWTSGRAVLGSRISHLGVTLDPTPRHLWTLPGSAELIASTAFGDGVFLVALKDGDGSLFVGRVNTLGLPEQPSVDALAPATVQARSRPAVVFDGAQFTVLVTDVASASASTLRGLRVRSNGDFVDRQLEVLRAEPGVLGPPSAAAHPGPQPEGTLIVAQTISIGGGDGAFTVSVLVSWPRNNGERCTVDADCKSDICVSGRCASFRDGGVDLDGGADAGVDEDAGAPVPDAGIPDSGMRDAGTPAARDAGSGQTGADGGVEVPLDGRCSCDASGAGLALMVLLGLLRRARRP